MVKTRYYDSISLNSIPKIEPLLNTYLSFFDYCTQKRNLCYLLQLYYFLQAMLLANPIKFGLKSLYLVHLTHFSADIIEAYLFCTLNTLDTYKMVSGGGKKVKAMNYLNFAKKNGYISKQTYIKAMKIISIRNKFHPSIQDELLIKTDEDVILNCQNVVEEIHNDVKRFILNERGLKFIENEFDTDRICVICGSLLHGNKCLKCGDAPF